MNDIISTLKSKRSELALELGRIDKAIAILSNGSGGNGGSGKATRARATGRPMSAAMKAKIRRGVRKAFLQRKREAAAKAKS
jgi:hypothetical protein